MSDKFSSRFSDFRLLETKLRLFSTPFDVDKLKIPENFQMEVIELKCNAQLKSKFYACENLIIFYKENLSSDEYPNLVKNGKQMISIFGSTYNCEQLFSTMNYTKSKLRSRITDNHLTDVLRIASSTSLSPNINKLTQDKLAQMKQGLN